MTFDSGHVFDLYFTVYEQFHGRFIFTITSRKHCEFVFLKWKMCLNTANKLLNKKFKSNSQIIY